MMKAPWSISLANRTNLVALATVAAGLIKMFRPELAEFEGDALQLITTGLGMLYIREAIGHAQ